MEADGLGRVLGGSDVERGQQHPLRRGLAVGRGAPSPSRSPAEHRPEGPNRSPPVSRASAVTTSVFQMRYYVFAFAAELYGGS